MNIVYLENLFFTISFIIYIIGALSFIIYLAFSKENVGKYGVIASILGFITHTLAIILRVIESGRLPFSNQFELANSFTWGTVLCYLVIHFMFKFRAIGAFVMPLALIMMGYASMLPRAIKPLIPTLQSKWLSIHVGTAIISYGSFAVAAGLALMYLINFYNKDKENKGLNLPDREVCDYISYRVIALGYLMLTLVIVTGAIWAKKAWSRYWGWDPKETWSLITWIIYSTYLHLRFNRGWRGKAAAWFALIGFISMIFTFIGVNVLLSGIHSYK